jgi:hypothetical protein
MQKKKGTLDLKGEIEIDLEVNSQFERNLGKDVSLDVHRGVKDNTQVGFENDIDLGFDDGVQSDIYFSSITTASMVVISTVAGRVVSVVAMVRWPVVTIVSGGWRVGYLRSNPL